MTDRPPFHRFSFSLRICYQLRCVFERRLFEEFAGLLLISNLGFNFMPQRIIAAAGFIEKGCTLSDSAL
ncbi:MAG TPA: hypothetical protein VN687_19175 [Blastocatellia bacterium]|nr:hypothetical protein [Blastocatellia bacterium]